MTGAATGASGQWPYDVLQRVPADITAAVVIDLGAIRQNYRTLAARAAPARTAAVVKADAYGLGIERIVPVLRQAGCDTFFVHSIEEGRRARAAARDAIVYVLGGLLPGTEPLYAATGLRPVLNDIEQIAMLGAYGAALASRLPAAIHIDTGMNRLGVPHRSADEAARAVAAHAAIDLTLILGHFANADVPEDPTNGRQLARFEAACSAFAGVPRSLANSAALLTNKRAHCALVRPGIALYGGNPTPGIPQPLRPVAAFFARTLQVRPLEPGERVGYGGTFASADASAGGRIVTAGIGYADGLLRGTRTLPRAGGAEMRTLQGARLPLAGRISMDSCTLDASGIAPEASPGRGDWLELTGLAPGRATIDDLAAAADTIAYEVLTRIGPRVARVYLEPE
jgi:alanine racemase